MQFSSMAFAAFFLVKIATYFFVGEYGRSVLVCQYPRQYSILYDLIFLRQPHKISCRIHIENTIT